MKIVSSFNTTIIVTFLTFISFFSCSNDDNLNNLDATVFVRHKDADMPAYIHGNATEKIFLITLHGGPGGFGLALRTGMMKSKIEKEVAVVYFDQRGSGNAQGNYDENGINVDIMAEDVLALVKVLKRKYGDDSRFFLLGHSWGGTLGTATLLKDQSDFLGWIPVASAHGPSTIYAEYLLNFRRVAAEQIALGNSIDYWESVIDLTNMVSQTFNMNDVRTLNIEAGEAERVLRNDNLINREEDDSDIFFEYNLLTIIWNVYNTQSILDTELFQSISFTDRLQEITVPSLVLTGRYDMVVPFSYGPESFDNLGSTSKKLVIFEKSGHSPMRTEPDLYAAELINFINANK